MVKTSPMQETTKIYSGLKSTGVTHAARVGPARISCRRPPLLKLGVRAEAAGIIYQPTGVPLLDQLHEMPTVYDAGIHGIKHLAITAIVFCTAALLLRALDASFGEKASFVADMTVAVSKPSQIVLPFFWIFEAIKVIAAVSQEYATRAQGGFNTFCFGYGPQVLRTLETATQFLQDFGELAVVIFIAWSIDRFKDRLIKRFLKTESAAQIACLIAPLSKIITYTIVGTSFMITLSNFGINIQPLLTSIGASSVIIGIASQDLLSNVGSGVALYTSQSFMPGDSILLVNTDGDAVLEGDVVRIEPLRTVIRSKDGHAIFIRNATVLEFIVHNNSRKV